MPNSKMTQNAELHVASGDSLVLLPFAFWDVMQPGTPGWTFQTTALTVSAALVPNLCAYLIYGWSQKNTRCQQLALTHYLGPLYAACVA
jgi:hypothetical protein